jgi:mycothiol synthase
VSSAPQHPDVSFRAATPDDIAAIHAAVVASDRVDHPTWVTPREEIAEIFEMSHVEPARDTMLAIAPDGSVAAMGWAMVHPSQDAALHAYLQGTVRPDQRRRGVGTALIGWLYERAIELLAETGSGAPAAIFQYVDEPNPDAVTLGERLGLRTERWFTSMQRDLSEPIDVVEPAVDATKTLSAETRTLSAGEVEFVPYTAERAADVLEARNDAFRDHWGSLPSTPERWGQFVGGPFLRPDLSTLALIDGRVVAFCLASVNEEDWEALGAPHTYIDLIGVVRDQRGRRLAPAVIARTLEAARAAGLEQAVLDVDTASKTGANTLYERLGFRATQRSRALVRHL